MLEPLLDTRVAVTVAGRAVFDSLDDAARANLTALEAAASAFELRVIVGPARHRTRRWTDRRVPAADLVALVAETPMDIPTLAERAYRAPSSPWTPSDRSWAEQKTRVAVFKLVRNGVVVRMRGPNGEELVSASGVAR